jgi:AraC-like DNA-binding protein
VADLARLAADLGYADQAHMTRDCVRLTGMPPARLAALWAG